MKKHILLFFLSLCSLSCYSQREANIWYFGVNAGIDFNTGSPVDLNNGIIRTNEGCATICNNSGQLLFYTDGVNVRDRTHNLMSNGSNLDGDYSSTQSSIIVPKPNSNSIYYIFTVAAIAGEKGLRYSEVDMNLNNGFGDVTSLKNVFISTPVCEKVCAIKNATGDGYWVVSHSFGDNKFLSIEVNESGIGNVVFTPIGTVVDSNLPYGVYTSQGYLKISSDGTKLVCVNGYNDVQLFAFDTATGVVSNVKRVNSSNNYYCYGAEFSQSGDKLYLTAGGRVLQYDLTAVNIPNSEMVIHTSYTTFGALQMASDGKIYCAKIREVAESQSYLSVINNPEASGVGCQFQLNQVGLTGTSIVGLPQSIQSIFDVSIIADNTCETNVTLFSVNGNLPVLSAIWDFGDGTTSTSLNPGHLYNSAGSYTVSATFTTANGNLTKTKVINILPNPTANPVNPINLCAAINSVYNLGILNPSIIGNQPMNGIALSYFSSITDVIDHKNELAYLQNLPVGESTFYAKVYSFNKFNCYGVTTVVINLTEQPILRANIELLACDSFPYVEIGTFDLNTIANDIVENPNNYAITYHLTQVDALSDSNAVSLNYTTALVVEVLYVRVENNSNPTCFSIETITLKVIREPIIAAISDLFACEDTLPNDGAIRFDLSIKDLEILNGQSGTQFDVDYYLTSSDAQNDINPLNQFFINSTNPQTLYVRIFNIEARNCYKIGSFNLNVNPKPDFLFDSTYIICEANNAISISVPNDFSHYQWSNGAATPKATISQPGNYTVTVGQQYGNLRCEATKSFTVVESEAATIVEIEISDFNGNNNVISVNVSGSGNYEYSVDGIHYQDFNVFYGLGSGEYIVFVRDKNGCGIIQERIYLLDYPKFFTPNGDGINDYWRIEFSAFEPNLKVEIFDRYGKRIKDLNADSIGWNGKLNDKLLPSDDYWFVVIRENGKQYRGHFSLKR